MDEEGMQHLEVRFNAHSVTPEKVNAMKNIRNKLKSAAKMITLLVPDCGEQDVAIHKLEEAMFWANAGISRQTKREVSDEIQVRNRANVASKDDAVLERDEEE